jgi:hypothetical protein
MFTEENQVIRRSGPLADLDRETGPVRQGERIIGGATNPHIYFPSDLAQIGHWVTFRAFKFEKISGRTKTDISPLTAITLPVPTALDTAYSANYENGSGIRAALTGDIAGSSVAGDLKTAVGSMIKKDKTAEEAISELVKGQQFDSITKSFGDAKGAAGAAAITIASGLIAERGGVATKTAVANAGGVAANPFNVLLYQGPGFRSHSFSYRLTARNITDSDKIRDIIYAFKYHMSGKYGIGKLKQFLPDTIQKLDENVATDVPARAFLEYPEYFEITFHYEKYLFRIGPSVLKNFAVSYHPENYPAYVRSKTNPNNDPAPLEVAIRMDFQERDIVTKDSIEDQFT